jgi:16S rRNA (cytosine967-C5)-methyltransferase
MSSRQVAAELVSRWLDTGDFPDRLLQAVHADRPFITEIVLGVARRRRTLEWALERHMRHRPGGMLGACLLVGAYQILFMTNVAEYAIVNETVEAANALIGKRSRSVVNGVLRNLLRHRDALRAELQKEKLAIRESHPDALVDRWVARLGEEATVSICRWNNQLPKLTVCLNSSRRSVSQFMTDLGAAGIHAEPHPAAPSTCVILPSGTNPSRLPGYAEGFFTVQDPAGLKAIELLNAQPGERILDACAAPGGKAVRIAIAMQGKGTFVAMDKHDDRLTRLKENLERMSLEATIVRGDACTANLRALIDGEMFDRILLDIPCTNTGVLSRRPDARWRFSKTRLKTMTAQQKAMLENAAKAVRPGGCLVYSTCSIEPEEGEELVTSWCLAHATFELKESQWLIPPGAMTDGAFAAQIVRVA